MTEQEFVFMFMAHAGADKGNLSQKRTNVEALVLEALDLYLETSLAFKKFNGISDETLPGPSR
jgi:hypothetical protein